LQRIKLFHPLDGSVLYTSVDNIWFSERRLYDMAVEFVKRGGKYLFLDEVHKYPNWSQELKNIYDDLPELKVVFTGSSLLEILNAKADLSRRAIVYEMQGFSFREYLNRNLNLTLPVLNLENVLTNHLALSQQVLSRVKVLKYFPEYLKNGYYPFYNELPGLYYNRIDEIINYHHLSGLFDTVSVSARCRSGKDQRRIFDITLESLGILPHEAVFIDNSDKNLIVPREMGIKPILFDDESRDISRFLLELQRYI